LPGALVLIDRLLNNVGVVLPPGKVTSSKNPAVSLVAGAVDGTSHQVNRVKPDVFRAEGRE